MTDKQIIIDGIDLSGCIYYDNGKCLNDEIVQCNCKNVAVCYYKEYKRKEQECEELKIYIESNEQQVKEVETLVRDNDRLINELDRLNEDRIDALKQLEFVRTLNTVKEAETIKLHKTLTEIKEITEKCCIMQTILDCNNYDDCTQCGRISDGEGIQQIFQKINEVRE